MYITAIFRNKNSNEFVAVHILLQDLDEIYRIGQYFKHNSACSKQIQLSTDFSKNENFHKFVFKAQFNTPCRYLVKKCLFFEINDFYIFPQFGLVIYSSEIKNDCIKPTSIIYNFIDDG